MPEGHPGMELARDIVAAQVVAVAVGTTVAAVGSGTAALAAGIVAMVLALIPWDGRRAIGHVNTAVRYALRGRTAPHTRTISTIDRHGRAVGVVWNGSDLSMVVELRLDGPGGWTTIGASGLVPDVVVPLRALVEGLQRTDAPFDLAVRTAGTRPERGRRASDAYASMAGSLASVAHRRTWLVLSVDVHAGTDESDRRGGGLDGACELLAGHTSRIRHTLRTAGIRGVVLARDEIDDADLFVTRGVPRRHIRQTWTSATTGGSAWTLRRAHPRRWSSGTVDEIFDCDATSTALSIGVRSPVGDEVRMSAIYGHVEQRHTGGTVRGSATLCGVQRSALDAMLPSTARAHLRHDVVDVSLLDKVAVPVAGHGQIIGVDADGAAVAVRLHGRARTTISVRSELYLVHQIVFRAVATGARVVIVTDRHHAWRHLATSVSDSGAVSVVAPGADLARATTPDLIVVDHTAVGTVDSDANILRVDADGVADIVIDQPNSVGDIVSVSIGRRRTTLRLVTTAAETDAIGRPRMASRDRVHDRG